MAGIKGQMSGGHNKKSTARHIAEGTYRKDRHGVKLPAVRPAAPVTNSEPLTTLNFSEHEQDMAALVSKILGVPRQDMGLRYSTLVQTLSRYVIAHEKLLTAGDITTNRFGEKVESVEFSNRRKTLADLQREMSAFAMSYSEQASLTELALRTRDRMKKPTDLGKPLE